MYYSKVKWTALISVLLSFFELTKLRTFASTVFLQNVETQKHYNFEILSTIRAASRLHCFQKCIRIPPCESIDWDEITRECTLKKMLQTSTAPGNEEEGKSFIIESVQSYGLTAPLKDICTRSRLRSGKQTIYYLGCSKFSSLWLVYDISLLSYPYTSYKVNFPSKISNMTGCAWFQENGSSKPGAAIFLYGEPYDNAYCNDFGMFLFGSKLSINIRNNDKRVDATGIRDSNPHHVCMQWKSQGGNWRVFIDGNLHHQADNVYSEKKLAGNGEVFIGRNANAAGGTCNSAVNAPFNGKVNSVFLWNEYLTEEQIRLQYYYCKSDFNGLMFTMASHPPQFDQSRKEPFCQNI